MASVPASLAMTPEERALFDTLGTARKAYLSARDAVSAAKTATAGRKR